MGMSRAYIVYFLMFAAFAAGLWVVITLGAAAKAPDDLSGDWIVRWDNAPPPETADGDVMKVSQSGRFFVIRFGARPPMSMTLAEDWRGAQDGRQLKMHLSKAPWSLNVEGEVPARDHWRVPEVRLELSGPTRHTGIARRVVEQRAAVPQPTAPQAPQPPTSSPATRPAETAHAR